MPRRQREAAHHRPPFVDALATIIMVLTFLVIIIALALFYIAQKVNEDTVRQALDTILEEKQGSPNAMDEIILSQVMKVLSKASEKKVEGTPSNEPVPEDAEPAPAAQAQATPSPSQQSEAAQSQSTSSEVIKRESDSEETETAAAQGAKLQTEGETPQLVEPNDSVEIETEIQEETSGSTEFTTENKVTKDPPRVTFTPEEEEADAKEIDVSGQDVILAVDFPQEEIKLTEDAKSKVDALLETKQAELDRGVLEIRASARSSVGSISESRRIAYYRAVSIRNRLINAGVRPDKIQIRLTDNVENKNFDRVNVHLRPDE
ncbi:MAG: hypothetical protein AAGB03_01615 [Pseudomonadota bacterium]